MLEVGYGDVEEVLQFPCDTEELDDLLGLLAEVFVDLECCLCIDMGHLEVVLWILVSIPQVMLRISTHRVG